MNLLLPLFTLLLLTVVVAMDSRIVAGRPAKEREEDGYSRPYRNSRELHSKGYSKGSKGYSKGSKGYSKGSKGYSKGSKGYSKGSKGYSKGSKGYSKGSKGYSKGSKGYSKGSKGYSKGSKGYSGRRKRCVDFSDFEFKTENSGMKDCEWLRKVRKRQDKYCEMKGWDGESKWKVKFQCRRSCAKFLEGDKFERCDKYLDSCKDSNSFKFEVKELYGMKKGCDYLKGNSSTKEKRRDDYCKGSVKRACEKSCDNC